MKRISLLKRFLSRRASLQARRRGPLCEALESRTLLSGAPDLTVAFTTVNMPANVVQGVTAKASGKFTITNAGDAPVPTGTRIDVDLLARPAAGGEDIPLLTLHNLSISGLATSRFRTFTGSVVLPASLPDGDYTLVANADPGQLITELDDANNSAVTLASTHIAPPFINLTAAMGRVTVPASLIAGSAAKGSVKVLVTNAGNIPLPAGQTTSIRLVARPTGGGDDQLLGTIANKSVSRLAPGKFKTITSAATTFPITVPAGPYQIVALVDSADVLAESNELDNEAATPIGSPIDVIEGFFDLTASVKPTAVIPPSLLSGVGSHIHLPLIVQNLGNLPIPKAQLINIRVLARNTADNSETEMVTVATQSLGSLKPGKSKTLTLTVPLPRGLNGDFRIVAQVDSGSALAEKDETNNETAAATLVHFSPVSDFLELTGFDTPRTSTYDSIFTGNATSFGETGGHATVTSVITSPSDGVFVVTETADNGNGQTQVQTYHWNRVELANILSEMHVGIDIASFDFFWTNLKVSPAFLQFNKTVASTTDASCNLFINSLGSFFLTGTASSYTTLLGTESVTVPAGIFDAVKLFNTSVTRVSTTIGIPGGSAVLRFQFNQSITFWATPDQGVVKEIVDLQFTVSADGRSSSVFSTETRSLVSVA